MSTSLSEQLKRLAAPQTGVLKDSRRRASILFDSKEAATKDRKTIYEIGLSGLQELMAMNPSFQQFEHTLFDESTLHLERSMEVSEVNELLNKNIRKFMNHLSPYFMLRPAHMCIEWLLRRFQVNEYNREQFLALMLPYHETNIFIKCLQTIRIKADDVEFNWLKPLQKPGVALSKTAILNRAATNPAFLNFVCKSTLDAIKELGSRAHVLQAQINFYASVVVGALEHASTIEEWHISTILPSLLKGLSSEVVDFTSATYIVSSQLVSRTQLKLKLINALISKVAAVQFEQLRTAAILLLIWIFDTQAEMHPQFTTQVLKTLVQHKWLTSEISTLAKEGVEVHYLCVPMIRTSVEAIHEKHMSADIFQLFLERLLCDVEFPNSTAQEIISCFLDSFVSQNNSPSSTSPKEVNKDVIELDSDDDMGVEDEFQSWYSDYLKKLEIQYPSAFDATIKVALKSNTSENSNRSKALKMALGYRLKSFDNNSTDIYEQLYHHTSKIRINAIQTLMANLANYQAKPQNYQLLRECLADRIEDDSELVILEVLKLPTKDFIDILGYRKFVEALFKILLKGQTNGEKWSGLVLPVIQHLTAEIVVNNYDTNLILLSLMPILFPMISSKDACKNLNAVLKSPLKEKVKFLNELKVAEKKNTEFSATDFKRQFLDVISQSQHTPTALELFKSIDEQKDSEYFKMATHFAHFLLLVTAYLKQSNTGEESLWMFSIVQANCRNFKLKHIESKEWLLIDQHNIIPLQLFSDFLNTLMRRTKFSSLSNWETPSADLKCFLNVLNWLCTESFSQTNHQEKLEWSKSLRDILNIVFPNIQDKIVFLTNFYIYENLPYVDNYDALRLRCFKILNSVLLNKENKFNLSTEHVLKVLIALHSHCDIVRIQAVETLQCILKSKGLESTLKQFVECVLERSNEVSMDHEQFPLVLFTILKPTQKKSRNQMGPIILEQIIQTLEVEKDIENAVLKSKILQMLKHINDDDILAKLVPMALKALDKHEQNSESVKLLQDPFKSIYQLICERFDSNTIENVLVEQREAWDLFEKTFNNYNVFLVQEGKLQPVPCVLLEALDELAYEKMPSKYQYNFIKLVIKTVAQAENDSIFLTANKLLKKCFLNCSPLVDILQVMFKKSCTPSKAPPKKGKPTKGESNQPDLDINSLAWKEGVVLLELLENKKKLVGAEKIIPALFELLKQCHEVEEKSSVEYVKQLILSALLHCCQKANLDGIDLQTALPKSSFRIDQIVQCVRTSQNPQTHHNALLLLSHCASLFPQQVLLNIVDIFTFMGSSVVRRDDAFSFHIIQNIIESIVPILVKSTSQTGAGSVVPVLKVFSDIMLDVPEHRRLPLYTKLMNTLNPEKYMWMFLCVVFEAHVIDDEKQRLLQKKSKTTSTNVGGDKVSKRLEIAHNLACGFSPQIALQTCIELMGYIQNLPQQKDTKGETPQKKSISASGESEETNLFDIKCRTDKQLRHYKYVIIQFLSTFTGSPEFLRSVSVLSGEDLLAMKPYYQNFIIKTLSYVPTVTNAIEKADETSQTKFWKVILHHLHDVLDNAISLLSPDMFLVVIHGLMQHQLMSIRRKVIELLISKLQQRDSYFDDCNEQHFKNLLKPLNDIVEGILQKDESSSSSPNELVFIQQTALIAIKLLSKLFALKYIDEFKNILGNLTKITKKRTQVSKIVFATVILTMIEISSNLKAHSLAQLPKFMPQLTKVLEDQAEFVRQNAPDNVSLAIITGMQKLFDSLPLFLGPYTVDIIISLSSISTRIEAQLAEQTKDQRSTSILNKISSIWTRIATDIPVRILVSSCENAYNKLMSAKNYADIGMLMKLMLESVNHTQNTDLAAVQTELCDFFMSALEFRSQLADNAKYDVVKVTETELCILDAFVAWVLKLSESSFRPIYYRLYEWALKREASNETILTYFLLTNKIADALKSLFVLFASDIIQDAADLLNKHNSSKNEIDVETEYMSTELLKSILQTLHNIFLHDSKGFINSHRFEILMQPIVDQLENRLVLENKSLEEALTKCIAQLAVTVSNDVMWKQLNQQVLLKTRTNIPEVRIISFNCCLEIARKLGDDFTTLLPETVPFVAELFEDENPRVERNTRRCVQELESILGESLQKYL